MMKFLFLVCFLLASVAYTLAADNDVKPLRAAPMVMSTRGFSRTSVLDKSAGKEAITAYKFELPYGLAAGWRLPYLGFSEGAKDTIQITGFLVSFTTVKKEI